jgi:hypothetical protein
MKGHSVRLLKLTPLSTEEKEDDSFAWGIFDFMLK